MSLFPSSIGIDDIDIYLPRYTFAYLAYGVFHMTHEARTVTALQKLPCSTCSWWESIYDLTLPVDAG